MWLRLAYLGVTNALAVLRLLPMGDRDRLAQVGLELHPDKTRIVYCKDSNRRDAFEHTAFTFLGYTFRPRLAENRHGKRFVSFLPAAYVRFYERRGCDSPRRLSSPCAIRSRCWNGNWARRDRGFTRVIGEVGVLVTHQISDQFRSDLDLSVRHADQQ